MSYRNLVHATVLGVVLVLVNIMVIMVMVVVIMVMVVVMVLVFMVVVTRSAEWDCLGLTTHKDSGCSDWGGLPSGRT